LEETQKKPVLRSLKFPLEEGNFIDHCTGTDASKPGGKSEGLKIPHHMPQLGFIQNIEGYFSPWEIKP